MEPLAGRTDLGRFGHGAFTRPDRTSNGHHPSLTASGNATKPPNSRRPAYCFFGLGSYLGASLGRRGLLLLRSTGVTACGTIHCEARWLVKGSCWASQLESSVPPRPFFDPASGGYVDWKGPKSRTTLSANFALSSALGSARSSPETDHVAGIVSIRSPRCAACSMSASESLYLLLLGEAVHDDVIVRAPESSSQEHPSSPLSR